MESGGEKECTVGLLPDRRVHELAVHTVGVLLRSACTYLGILASNHDYQVGASGLSFSTKAEAIPEADTDVAQININCLHSNPI